MAEIVSQVCAHKKRLGEAIQLAIDKTARHWETPGAASSHQEGSGSGGVSSHQETDKFKELKQLVEMLQPKAQSQRQLPPSPAMQSHQSQGSSGQKRNHHGQSKKTRYWGRR